MYLREYGIWASVRMGIEGKKNLHSDSFRSYHSNYGCHLHTFSEIYRTQNSKALIPHNVRAPTAVLSSAQIPVFRTQIGHGGDLVDLMVCVSIYCTEG